MKEKENESISLVNSLVKTVDSSNGIDNTCLIPFMYPNYKITDELFFDYDNDVIYTGKCDHDIKERLSINTKSYIGICNNGVADVDFTDKETILKVLKDHHGGRFSEKKIELMLNMSDQEFWKLYKKFWVKNTAMEDDVEDNLFWELYKSLGGKSYDTMKIYFKLREHYSDSTIYSSILSFIDKSFHPDRVASQSGAYLGFLRKFRERCGSQAQAALMQAYMLECKSDSDRQYRTMMVIKSLGRGGVI